MKKIRMTTFYRGLLLISMPLFFQLLFLLFLMKFRADAAEADRMAMHSKDVLQHSSRVLAFLAEAQSASRGFVITANPVFDDEFQHAIAQAHAELAAVRELTSDNPSQQKRVEEWDLLATRLTDWLKEQEGRVKAGDVAAAQEQVRRLVGKHLVDEVRRALDAFLTEEGRLEQERLTLAAKERSRQGWVLFVGCIFSILVTGIAVRIFARDIASRLEVVTQNTRRIAENQPLAAPVGGEDEIAALDETLHATSERLRAAAAAEGEHKAELEARAAELARVNESLRQQTQENETFVYSVSHDLRSPLVNLQGFSKELVHASETLGTLLADPRVPAEVREQAGSIMQGDVKDSVRFIQSAVSRSSTIIDALLRLSRAGRVEYRMREVDLNAVLTRICEALSSTIDARGATVVAEPLLPAWGDPTALEQIFANLVGNAVNYLSPQRPGRVEVGMVNDGKLDEAGLRSYYVRDNGLGIPASHLPKLFVAFQRLHGEVAAGEGIGLALVRRSVERHGGRIWAESTENVGTTFFVVLPGKSPEAPASPAS